MLQTLRSWYSPYNNQISKQWVNRLL